MVNGNLLTLNKNIFQSFMEVCQSESLQGLCNGESVEGFNFTVSVSEEPKEGVGSREYFGKVVQKVIDVGGVGRYHDCEGRNKSSVGTHKPDYLVRSLKYAGEQGIVCIGELKGIADADKEFSDEEIGQILDFIQELLTKQGWRQWAFGFLTDGIRFEFFRGARLADGTTTFTKSGLLSRGTGWGRLAQLLQQSDECLGFSAVIVPGWNLDKWLGSGATTSVFTAISATNIGETAVCKIFIAGSAARACYDNEWEALQIMSANAHSPNPRAKLMVTGGLRSFPAIVVTPLGQPLGSQGVKLPIDAYAPLVDTLRYSHDRGRCHLDVCGDNMFAVERQTKKGLHGDHHRAYDVLLNDWASSMPTSAVQKTKNFYTHLLYYDARRMGPEEDLAALVRSVFVLTQCTFSLNNVEAAEDLDRIMRQQWSWGKALEKARDRNYDAVRHFFLSGRLADDASCDEKESLPIAKRKKEG